jgi:hypothetical protein
MREGERGESKVGTLIFLALLAGIAYAGLHVGPVYWDNYSLTDKIAELARQPRNQANDEKIYDQLVRYVREEGMGAEITRENFRIYTSEGHRTITCTYQRTTTILPGFSHTFPFALKVDQLLPY